MSGSSSKEDSWPIIRQDLVDRIGCLEVEQTKTTQQLINMIERLDRHGKMSETMYAEIKQLLDDSLIIMRGDGKVKGHGERLNRLEEADLDRKTHTRIFYAAILAGFGKWIWDIIGHGIK